MGSGARCPAAAVASPSAAPRPAPPPLWAAGRAPLSISGAGARPPPLRARPPPLRGGDITHPAAPSPPGGPHSPTCEAIPGPGPSPATASANRPTAPGRAVREAGRAAATSPQGAERRGGAGRGGRARRRAPGSAVGRGGGGDTLGTSAAAPARQSPREAAPGPGSGDGTRRRGLPGPVPAGGGGRERVPGLCGPAGGFAKLGRRRARCFCRHCGKTQPSRGRNPLIFILCIFKLPGTPKARLTPPPPPSASKALTGGRSAASRSGPAFLQRRLGPAPPHGGSLASG